MISLVNAEGIIFNLSVQYICLADSHPIYESVVMPYFVENKNPQKARYQSINSVVHIFVGRREITLLR